MDARDELQGVDSVGADGPIEPPRQWPPRDPERRRLLLLHVIAGATVVTAACSGLILWETHRTRAMEHDLYCSSYAVDYETGEPAEYDELDRSSKAMVDILGCDLD